MSEPGPDDDDLPIPAEIHEPFENLVNELLPCALDLIEAQDEFYPFAGYLLEDGTFEIVEASSDDEHPDAAAIFADLLDVMRGIVVKEKGIVAVGVASDVEIESPDTGKTIDAVALDLEHRTGVAHAAVVAYKKLPDGTVEDGELWVTEGDRRVFPKVG